jgi:tetratricopeptide (TPR) repeat protein
MRLLIRVLCSAIAIIVSYSIANAEDHYLIVQATDTQGRPIADIVITATGDSSQPITDISGKARIKLASETKPNDEITLLIVRSPEKKDLVLISPWNNRVRVPPFDNATQHVAEIVLEERGIRRLLESEQALIALASRLNAATAPKAINEKTTDEQRKAALEEVSKAFGLKPEDVDKAIRVWGERTNDPYERGLAALYEKNYPKATEELTRSLEIREKELKQKQSEVADAARFLGQSLYEQGRYNDAVAAYQKAVALRPDDTAIMNNLGLSLADAGRYAEAEPLYRRALAINEKALGADHPSVATGLNNLAGLHQSQGRYAEAEPLFKRALTIREKALGADHPSVATGLNNLAGLHQSQGRYAEAEPLYRRALAIDERALGADHPGTATDLNNLAGLHYGQGRYAEAEPLYRRALAINEKALGADHPSVAGGLNNLALLYKQQGRYAEAEPLYRRALAIDEKALGAGHPSVATILENYAALLRKIGREIEAAPMEARAKAIRDKNRQEKPKN